MSPTKSKGNKTQWVTTLLYPTKITKTAGNKKQVSATTVHGQHFMNAKEVADPTWVGISQKLDALIKTMSDLSGQMRYLSS